MATDRPSLPGKIWPERGETSCSYFGGLFQIGSRETKTKPARSAGEVEDDARTEYISRLVSKLHGKSECLVNFW